MYVIDLKTATINSLRAHQSSSGQTKISKEQSDQSTARVRSVAYGLLRSVLCDPCYISHTSATLKLNVKF